MGARPSVGVCAEGDCGRAEWGVGRCDRWRCRARSVARPGQVRPGQVRPGSGQGQARVRPARSGQAGLPREPPRHSGGIAVGQASQVRPGQAGPGRARPGEAGGRIGSVGWPGRSRWLPGRVGSVAGPGRAGPGRVGFGGRTVGRAEGTGSPGRTSAPFLHVSGWTSGAEAGALVRRCAPLGAPARWLSPV